MAAGGVLTWGDNSMGQLGIGVPPTMTPTATATSASKPTPVISPTPQPGSIATPVAGLGKVVAVTAGGYHSLVVDDHGTVSGWGDNSAGQLGDGTTTDRTVPATTIWTYTAHPAAVAAGQFHSLALASDGTVWAWGQNISGQLGIGVADGLAHSTPTRVAFPAGAPLMVAVGAGATHSLALGADGTVWTWGDNTNGQLGDGTVTSRAAPAAVPGLTNVVAIGTGAGEHSAVVRSDGTVWTWGYNAYGQLGDGTLTRRTSPVPVTGLSDVVQVSVNEFHTMALSRTGTAWGWGANAEGELGIGNNSDSSVPVQTTGLGPVAAIAAGSRHSLAITGDGHVWAWGYNAYGQLGDGTLEDRTSPVPAAGLSGAGGIAAGTSHSLAVGGPILNGPMPTPTSTPFGQPPSPDLYEPDDLVIEAKPLTLGDLNPAPHTFHVTGDQDWMSVAVLGGTTVQFSTTDPTCDADLSLFASDGTTLLASDKDSGPGFSAQIIYTFAQSAGGTYYLRARNYVVQTIDNLPPDPLEGTCAAYELTASLTTAPTATPAPTSSPTPTATSTRAVYSPTPTAAPAAPRVWGAGYFGQMGNGRLLDDFTPAPVANGGQARGIAAGAYHNLALLPDGSLLSWGSNEFGQLGDGTRTDRTLPAKVNSLSSVAAIAAGSDFSLALRSDGTIWAWGRNAFGQLGGATGACPPPPSPVPGASTLPPVPCSTGPIQVGGLPAAAMSGPSNAVPLAAGSGHALAVMADGSVRAWGLNTFGQLGDGTTTNRSAPVVVGGLDHVVAVAGGQAHSLALRSDGTVWAWGSDAHGQLGDGTTTNRSSSAQVPGLPVIRSIAAAGDHSLALGVDGSVWAWGANAHGEVGDGTSDDKLSPVQLFSVAGSVAIAAGEYHSLALKYDPSGPIVWAWGDNSHGQLGDGTTKDRTSPVQLSNTNGTTALAGGAFSTLSLATTDSPVLTVTPTPVGAGGGNTIPLPGVIKTIPLNYVTFQAAANSVTNRVYVTHPNNGLLTVIDGSTDTVLTTINVGNGPRGVAVNPTTNRIYVSNFSDATISVIDGSSNTVVDTVSVGSGPAGIGVDPSTNRVYVANYSGGTLTILDGASDARLADVSVGTNPAGVEVDPGTHLVYVARKGSGGVWVMDGTTSNQVTTVGAGSQPLGVGIDPTTHRVFVTNSGDSPGTVSVVDGSSSGSVRTIASVQVGSGAAGVRPNQNSQRVFVSNGNDGTVSVINATTNTLVVSAMAVGTQPGGIGVNTTTNKVYVALTSTAGPGVAVIQDYTSPGASVVPTVVPTVITTCISACVPLYIGVSSTAGTPGPVGPLGQPLTPVLPPMTPLSSSGLGRPTPSDSTPGPQALGRPTPTPLPLLSLDNLPFAVPPLPDGSEGTLALVQPGDGEVVAQAGGDDSLFARVVRKRDVDRSLLLRVGIVSTPGDALRLLPQDAAWRWSVQVDFFTPSGSPLHDHASPVAVCARVPSAVLDLAGGDLSRVALLRLDGDTGALERWPNDPSHAASDEVCIQTTRTSVFVLTVLPSGLVAQPIQDGQFFARTGFRIDTALWSYFSQMGGEAIFGAPISRPFLLNGLRAQVFENKVLQQQPDGQVTPLDLLSGPFFPYRHLGDATLPSDSWTLQIEAPKPDEPNLKLRAWSFVKSHVTNNLPGDSPAQFQSRYFGTLGCANAGSDGGCQDRGQQILDVELWGYPLADPEVDPTTPNFVYQTFERGVLRYNVATTVMDVLPMGVYWRSLITGDGLTQALSTESADSPYWHQYNQANIENGLNWPDDLPDVSMVAAFATDVPRSAMTDADFAQMSQGAGADGS